MKVTSEEEGVNYWFASASHVSPSSSPLLFLTGGDWEQQLFNTSCFWVNFYSVLENLRDSLLKMKRERRRFVKMMFLSDISMNVCGVFNCRHEGPLKIWMAVKCFMTFVNLNVPAF